MRRRPKEAVQRELDIVRDRLHLYLTREAEMLSKDGVQLYTIGSRNLQRYQTDLGNIRKEIDALTKRERELEAELAGQSPRRAISILPRDW